MDLAAIRRVYPTAIIVSLFISSILFANHLDDWAVGVLVGTLFGMMLLKSIEGVVRIFLPSRNRIVFFTLLLIKYFLVGAALYFLINYSFFNVIAFTIGFGLIQLVIVLKSIGCALFVAPNKVS